MSTNQIILEALKILGQLGVFGIAAYWIQKQIDKSSQKRLEEYKSTLFILQSKGTSLHEKRFEIIESLYAKLVDLEISMMNLTNPVKFTNDYKSTQAALVEKSYDDLQSFHFYFEKNKIYFNEATCKFIDDIQNAFYGAMGDYNYHRILEAHEETDRELIKDARQRMMNAYKSVKDEIPKLRTVLENEFRKILVVD